jgi:hypothetical protein
MRIIEPLWEEFRSHCIPALTFPNDVEHARAIFYAGFNAAMNRLTEDMPDNNKVYKTAVLTLQEMTEFMEEFNRND